nr:zinc finger protein ZFP2 [Misgurnus anguillicaudatus]XP_055027118.1 zinc finger protein ZFP2 [Misgurnus anguillicaudatus]
MEGGFPFVQTLTRIKTEDEIISPLYFNNQDETSQDFINECLKTENDTILTLKSELIYSDIQASKDQFKSDKDVFSFLHSQDDDKEFLDLGLQIKKEAFDNFPAGLIPPIEMEEEEFEIAWNTHASVDKTQNIQQNKMVRKKNCSAKQYKTQKSSKRKSDASSKAAGWSTEQTETKNIIPTQMNSNLSKRKKSVITPEKTGEARKPNQLHKEDLFSCETCGKAFHQSALLTDHVKIHRRQKPYTCDHCEMKFAKPSYLKIHLRRHAGDRPVSCDCCEKRFFDIYDLRVHQRDHTGERPFSCSECGKGFKRIYTLNKHKRTHSNEKPFQCSLCGKAYKYGYSYRLHLKDHLD